MCWEGAKSYFLNYNMASSFMDANNNDSVVQLNPWDPAEIAIIWIVALWIFDVESEVKSWWIHLQLEWTEAHQRCRCWLLPPAARTAVWADECPAPPAAHAWHCSRPGWLTESRWLKVYDLSISGCCPARPASSCEPSLLWLACYNGVIKVVEPKRLIRVITWVLRTGTSSTGPSPQRCCCCCCCTQSESLHAPAGSGGRDARCPCAQRGGQLHQTCTVAQTTTEWHSKRKIFYSVANFLAKLATFQLPMTTLFLCKQAANLATFPGGTSDFNGILQADIKVHLASLTC